MRSKPRLSVCIPTFSRLNYLKEVLTLLLPQASLAGVEVCVSDNNSADGTQQFLEQLEPKCIFKYVIQDKNIGIDGNMRAVISMATGDYVYPLGDDDMLPPGSLDLIIKQLESGGDLIVLNGWHTNRFLVPLKKHLCHKLAGYVSDKPVEAFVELWDKMPFGSFIATKNCFEQKNFDRFMGTSHAYTGAVWDALAEKTEVIGSCQIKCMEIPTVLLRGAEKTWGKNAAQILLVEIPAWFDLVAMNCKYRKAALEIKSAYISRQTKLIALIRLRLAGQLKIDTVKSLSLACSRLQKFRVLCVANFPEKLIPIVNKIRARIGSS